MKAIMNSHFAWLMKREYWESRGGFLRAQVVVGATLVVLTILGIIIFEVFRVHASADVGVSFGGTSLAHALNAASSQNPEAFGQFLGGVMTMFGFFAGVVLTFVVFFYLLGALYDDRRDRSILFWKSLPVSDTATVTAKVVAGIIVAPLVSVVMVLAGFLAESVILSLWLAAHGLNPFPLVWTHAQPYSLWLHLLATVPLYAVWALPTVGWLLLWSALVRSKPFLWAVVIPIAAGFLNWWIALLGIPHINLEFFWKLVARALLSIVPGGWVSVMKVGDPASTFADPPAIVRHFGSYSQMAHVFTTPELWIGAIAGIGLIAIAIWLRRWRSEA